MDQSHAPWYKQEYTTYSYINDQARSVEKGWGKLAYILMKSLLSAY